MASANLSTIETLARDYCQDNDASTALYSITQAKMWEVINRYYVRYKLTSRPWTQDLPASTTGLTVTAGVNTIFATTITTIRHFHDLYLTASVGSLTRTSQALQRCEPYEVDLWLANYASPANALISRYSATRIGDSTKAAGMVGAWMLHFYPAPTVTAYLIARCTLEATALTVGTDVPDLTDEEGNGLAVLAGAWAAVRMGRPALAQSILSELPASMQAIAAGLSADKTEVA